MLGTLQTDMQSCRWIVEVSEKIIGSYSRSSIAHIESIFTWKSKEGKVGFPRLSLRRGK